MSGTRWLTAIRALVTVVFTILALASLPLAAAQAQPHCTYDRTAQLFSAPTAQPVIGWAPLWPRGDGAKRPSARASEIASGFAAEASGSSVSSIGAAHVGDEAFSSGTNDLIQETLAGKGNFTSKYYVGGSEGLSAGEDFLGEGYTELGQPGSGVFRSADQLRQFRMDTGSLEGDHAPFSPHMHFEIFDSPGAARPVINNHVPFYDEFLMDLP